jgi:YD repeat-containing protein
VNTPINFSKQPAVSSRVTGGGSFSAASFGAAWVRPPLHPEPSDIVLVSEQRYALDGGASSSIDPQGTVTSEQRDQAGRRIQLTENAGGETLQRRVSQFQYAPDGGLKRLILQNPTTGEQVTTWEYGTTLAASGIARSDLPVSKTYPTGESETQTYNRQSEVQTMTDPNGSVHNYRRDKLGKLTDDQIVTLASEVDGLVRRISTTYDERGRVQFITSGSEPEPGAGTVINQVAYSYNGIDCLTKEAQSNSGVVDGSTPSVQYNCTGALDNVLRRTALVYPDGRTVSYEYGAAGSIDDVLNRVQSVHDDDLTVLAEFQYLGTARQAATTGHP